MTTTEQQAATPTRTPSLAPEFLAAAGDWRRWHEGEGAAWPDLAVQRRYGRRWRWWALWERVWDGWVAAGAAHSLAEYLTWSTAYWAPLEALLADACPYNPAIEITWWDALHDGPWRLAEWSAVVRRTWAQMTLPPPVIPVGGDRTRDWVQALRAGGLSRSQADKLRHRVRAVATALGLPPEALTPDLPGLTLPERSAIQRWRAWLDAAAGGSP